MATKKELEKQRQKIIERNRELSQAIIKANKPLDKMRTEIFQNTKAINRLNQEILSAY